MARLRKPRRNFNHEFELDLAPLLAVMVKLVPVLLLSSAFVQVMMIESDLPQAVKEAIAQQDPEKPKAIIQLEVSIKDGVTIVVQADGKQIKENVAMNKQTFDYKALHKALQKVKAQYPDVYRIEMAPQADVSYQFIVKVMDEARRSRDKDVRFPVYDKKENKQIMTDYMFPDVVFVNMMDG